MRAVQVSPSLRVLDVSSQSMGDPGAEAIAEAVRANKTLQAVYMDGNDLGARGAKSVAQAITV